MSSLPPATILIFGALLLPFFPRSARSALAVLFPVAAFAHLCALEPGTSLTVPYLDYELVLSRVDRLSLAFGYVFALVAFLGAVYSFHVAETGQQVAALLYAGSALGATFAGDWFTLYVFWEIMAIASVWLIWARRTSRSDRAGMRYLLVHLFGGVVLLAGILWQIDATGSLLFDRLEGGGGAALILFGFALNAAVPPLHAWLADAYPEATVTGSVFLSAFTTKTAVYVLARGFAGWEILVIAGTIMAVYGVVFAFVENDIRRILAYHIVSQVGYMVAGVGLGGEIAVNGATAHAFAHILYKGLLFMGTGAVLYSTGRSKLTELGGLAGPLRWVLVFYMVGALSISAFPLLSGFVSKSMVIYAAEHAHRTWVVLFLQVASVGTFLSVGLKLPYFTWFGPARPLHTAPVPPGMIAAMALAGAVNLAIGLYPALLYRVLPFPVDYHPYTAAHLLETLELLTFTGFGFWLLLGKIGGKPAITLDVDWIYRRPAPLLNRLVVVSLNRLFAAAESATLALARLVAGASVNPAEIFSLKRAVASPYDPDAHRPAVGVIVWVVVACFVILLAWGLLGA